jgi:sec-independent protein translocase protein TatC
MARALSHIPHPPRPHRPHRPDWLRPDDGTPEVFEEMTLGEHLIELRTRMVRACLSIGAAFIVGLIAAKPMLDKIRNDSLAKHGFDIRSPVDPLTIYFKVALYIAVALAFPLIVYQVLAFVAPGLTRREKRVVYTALPFVALLAILGGAYGLLIAAPRALYFLSHFMPSIFQWQPDADMIITFYLTLMLGLALAFQIPVVMFILAKIGIVSPRRMASIRKYAFIVILILAAIITPSTDPFNMMIVAVPLYVLYEFGIVMARLFAKTPIISIPPPAPGAA